MKYPPDETAPLLFNLKSDPYERTDLADSNQQATKRLARKIAVGGRERADRRASIK